MSLSPKLSKTMRETLRRLPDEWVSFTSGFVTCFPSVEALEKRGLAQVRITGRGRRSIMGGTMQVRRTPAGRELIGEQP